VPDSQQSTQTLSATCKSVNCGTVKGTLSPDSLLQIFFSLIIFLKTPENNRGRVISNFLQKFAKILASQVAPPVLTTLASKLPPVSTNRWQILPTVPLVVLIPIANLYLCQQYQRQFAPGVNDASGKLPPVSTTPVPNLPLVSTTPVANNGNNIRLLTT
jgi:hypothetical protein